MGRPGYKGLKEKWLKAGKRLVLFDYDGTLVEYHNQPGLALPDKRLEEILGRFRDLDGTEFYIITGRGQQDIDKILKNKMLSVIADHGATVRENGNWRNLFDEDTGWKQEIRNVVGAAVKACPGSSFEEKAFSFSWHYRNVSEPVGELHANKLIRKLNGFIHDKKLRVNNGNMVVEVMPESISKAAAIHNLFNIPDYDLVLCAGDDRTDEDMFLFLGKYSNATTIKVGHGETFAGFTIGSVSNVLDMLETLLI
jgi:trehalose 6-phosphate synthase/phosphatase